MAAVVPSRDPVAAKRALNQVRQDKRREVGDGFDGSWVAHPDSVPVAMEQFDAVLGDRPNQVDRLRPEVHVTAEDLLDLRIDGAVTDAGVHSNVSIAVRYIESWLRGVGAAAIDNLMEDAATAEISRSQLWQWIHQRVTTAEGTLITHEVVERELAAVLAAAPEGGRFEDAAAVFRTVTLEESFPTFLTITAYTRYLVESPETVGV
jgi:malate synthase